jgi:SAM-dependent methyltransferase
MLLNSLSNTKGLILDVGCGQGGIMKLIKTRKQLFSVGADRFYPYLCNCRETRSHDGLVLCDIRSLPFKANSFDTVLCFQVIEHLLKDEGLMLIRSMEYVARNKVIIGAPVGPDIGELPLEDNPLQRHKSIWWPSDFELMGYQVTGAGISSLERIIIRGSNLEGPRTCGRRSNIPFKPLDMLSATASIISWPLRMISRFAPIIGSNMICCKSVSKPTECTSTNGVALKDLKLETK